MLLNGAQVGSSGRVVNLGSGHVVEFNFQRYYNDGTNNVYVDHVNGGGGAPSLSWPEGGCSRQFVFPPIPAYDHAVYYVRVAGGDPYGGTAC